MEEQKQGGGAKAGTSKSSTTKAGVITKDDFTADLHESSENMIDTSSIKKQVKDRDLFNLDGTSDGEEAKQ